MKALQPKKPADAAEKPKTTRRRQPEEVRARVLRAALQVFAEQGFDGATNRFIAQRAKVKPSLLLYHFKSKDNLWRTVMTQVMTEYSMGLGDEFAKARTHSPSEVLKAVIERMVRHYADVPELHRIMTELGQRDSERFQWIMDHFVESGFQKLCALIEAAQKEGLVRQIPAARLRYAIVSMASVPFSIPHEYERLMGAKFSKEEEVKATTELINALVFTRD